MKSADDKRTPTRPKLDSKYADDVVDAALREDLGPGDITADSIFSENAQCDAAIKAKAEGIIAGLPLAKRVFRRLDAEAEWIELKREGNGVEPGEMVARISGRARAVLSGERTALNFISRLSGIATLTHRFVTAVSGLPVKILDTRKTVPGMRALDKYGVTVGGGTNHRFGLFDGVLIKDNHIALAGGIENAVSKLRKNLKRGMPIEVETTTLEEVSEALSAGADIIMLDNMDLRTISKAVDLIRGRALVEVSGGVSLENVREVAETGVQLISVGSLTHSAPALDVSMDML